MSFDVTCVFSSCLSAAGRQRWDPTLSSAALPPSYFYFPIFLFSSIIHNQVFLLLNNTLSDFFVADALLSLSLFYFYQCITFYFGFFGRRIYWHLVSEKRSRVKCLTRPARFIHLFTHPCCGFAKRLKTRSSPFFFSFPFLCFYINFSLSLPSLILFHRPHTQSA